MAVPKRKLSKSKIRMRKRSHAHKEFLTASKPCPNCGEKHLPHRVCAACGYYGGRQVISVTVKG